MHNTNKRAYNLLSFILSVRSWKFPTAFLLLALAAFSYFIVSQPRSSEAKLASPPPPLATFDIGSGRRTFEAQLGRDTKSRYLGAEKLQRVVKGGQAQPLSMISDDFNGDGMSDLVIGYAGHGGGILSLRLGNLEAIAPQDPAVFKGISEGRYPSPFLSQATLYALPEAPAFLEVGDFNADGYSDVLAASRGGNQLYLARGDGRGQLKPVETIALDGYLTAMKAGTPQLGRLTELAVGVIAADGPKLAVYTAGHQGIAGEADLYPVPSEVSALAFGRFDEDDASDLAAAAGNEVFFVRGHAASFAEEGGTQLERASFPIAIKGLAAGEFIFDRNHQTELALLSDDGTVYVSARGQLDTRPYTLREKQLVRKQRIAIRKGEQDQESLTILLKKMVRPSSQTSDWHIADVIKTGVTPAFNTAAQAVFKSGRTIGMHTDDLIIGDAGKGGVKTIRNLADARRLKTKDLETIAASDELQTEGTPLAVLSLRTSVGVNPGSVVLQAGEVEPLVTILAAQTYTVDTTTDSAAAAQQVCSGAANDCSLRGAVIKSNGNSGADTILLAAATTYTLTLGPYDDEFNFGGDAAQSGDLDIFDSVSITGANRDTTIIQMGILSPAPGGINKDRVLETNNFIVPQHAYNVTLSNLTIQNGNAPRTPAPDNYNTAGGGIMYDGFESNTNQPSGILTLTNTRVTTNTAAGQGGGITTVDATLIVQSTSIVAANVCTFAAGGGISYNGGNAVVTQSLQINNSTIGGPLVGDGNQANDATFGIGGGVDSVGGASCTISNGAVLQNNVAGVTTGANGGGGIHFGNTAAIAISNTTISNNLSKNHGGGLWSSARHAGTNAASTIQLTTVTIQNNQADSDNASAGDGGGIYNFFGAMTINNTSGGSISSNTARNGGGISTTWTGNSIDSTAPFTMSGSSISSNNARNDGGGIYMNPGAATTFGAISLSSLTLNNNTANSDSSGSGDGGGLFVGSGPLATFNGVTVDSNVANSGSGDGIRLAGGSINAQGTININGGDSIYLSGGTFTSTTGIMNLTGNLTRDTGNTFTHNTGTVNFNGSGDQLLNGTATSIIFHNFIVNKGGGALTTGGSLATITTNDMTLTAGSFTGPATLDINGQTLLSAGTFTAGASILVNLNWTNNGATFTPGSGTVTFDGGGAQSINGTAASQTFNNFTINKSGGSTLSTGGSTTSLTVNNLTETLGNFTAPATLDINGNTTLTAGIFTAGATITAAGNWTNNGGTFVPNAGTVTFDGGAAQNLNGTAATQTFHNFTVNKSNLLTGGGNLTTLNVLGNFSITGGGFVAGTIATLNLTGNWNNTAAFTAGSSTVILIGNNNTQTLSGSTTFNNLTSNHTGTGSVTAAGSTLAVTGLMRVQAGTFTSSSTFNNVQIDSGATLAGTAATTMNVGGNWTNNGTFTPNTNTVNFNGAGAQVIGGSAVTSFHHLTIANAGSGVSLSQNATANGTLTLTNDLSTGANTLTQPSTAPVSAGVGDVIGNVKRTNFPSSLPSATVLTFGNPNNQITIDSGTAPTDININLVKAVPSGGIAFPTAVQRTYTITPTGGSGISATLRLRYLDGELNGNTEAGLGLWRFDTAWVRLGRTANDTTNNWVELSGITQFSPWTLSSGKNDTTTTITSDNPDSSNTGEAVTVNFSVVSNVTGAPAVTGNVTVTVNDASGDTCTGTVASGTCSLTLTTPGSKTLTASYSGDDNFNVSADTEPHQVISPADIFVRDARVAEPASGSTSMLFTVVLSTSSANNVSVNFTTNTGGANPATAGTDYTTTSGTVTFLPGQRVQTISVPVLADADSTETDETFVVDLSSPVNGTIVDGQAVGTITVANTPGDALISEIRTSGPGGTNDDFVEIYNNTAAEVTVAASDASAGYGLFKMGAACGDTPVLVGTIPNGTVIPARGHYLFVGTTYSLADYGGTGAAAGNATLTADIENDRNVAIFNTNDVVNLSSTTRLDAVGFDLNTGNNCDLLREGSTLPGAAGSTAEHSFVRKETTGRPQDTNDNAADFVVVSTTPTIAVGNNAAPLLGAPGPENSTSPLQRNSTIKASLVDPGVTSGTAPNRERDTTPDCPNNSCLGTLDIRRKFTNNTGAAVTRLRFRIVDITSFPPGGNADLRARTSGSVLVNLSGGGTATVEGTTVETPPAQPSGGALNSTMSAGTVTVAVPIANGASINLRFLLGVQQGGSYRFFVNVEALP